MAGGMRSKNPRKRSRREFMIDAAALIGAGATGACSLRLDLDELTKGPDLKAVRAWALQYQNISWRQLADSSFDLLVVDDHSTISGMESFDTKAKIEALHKSRGISGQRKIAIGYISIGEASDFRFYWQALPKDLLVGEDPAGWEGSSLVKYWDPRWKKVALRYLDAIIYSGFEGILMDWVGAYSANGIKEEAVKAGVDPASEMIRFIAEISEYAKSRRENFRVMALNGSDLGLYPGYPDHIDAIVQEHLLFAGDYPGKKMGDIPVDPQTSLNVFNSLKRFQDAGIPVYHIEYAEEPKNIAAAYDFGAHHGFRTYVATLLLDSLGRMPPSD